MKNNRTIEQIKQQIADELGSFAPGNTQALAEAVQRREREAAGVWTIYWRDGQREVVTGETLEAAMEAAGNPIGLIDIADHIVEGDDHSYVWNPKSVLNAFGAWETI